MHNMLNINFAELINNGQFIEAENLIYHLTNDPDEQTNILVLILNYLKDISIEDYGGIGGVGGVGGFTQVILKLGINLAVEKFFSNTSQTLPNFYHMNPIDQINILSILLQNVKYVYFDIIEKLINDGIFIPDSNIGKDLIPKVLEADEKRLEQKLYEVNKLIKLGFKTKHSDDVKLLELNINKTPENLQSLSSKAVSKYGLSTEELTWTTELMVKQNDDIGKLANFLEYVVKFIVDLKDFVDLPDYLDLKVKKICPDDSNPLTPDIMKLAKNNYKNLKNISKLLNNTEKNLIISYNTGVYNQQKFNKEELKKIRPSYNGGLINIDNIYDFIIRLAFSRRDQFKNYTTKFFFIGLDDFDFINQLIIHLFNLICYMFLI